jgi:Aspartyl protease
LSRASHYFHPFIFVCLLIGQTAFSAGSTVSNFSPHRIVLSADWVALPTFGDNDGALWVEVRINDAGPFWLMVDTGCDGLMLAQHVADAAGLSVLSRSKFSIHGSVADDALAKVTWVEHLKSGGLRLEDIAAIVVDNADLANMNAALGNRMDGVLGMAALKDVLLEMDFAGRQVAVARLGTRHYPPERAVPYQGNVPLATMSIRGKTMEVLIDTGRSGGLGIPRLEAVPLLFPKVKKDGSAVGIGKLSMRNEWGQLAGEARLGPVTWVNPPVYRSRSGNIGVAALNTWKLAINQQAHEIYFLDGNLRLKWDKQKPPALRFKPGIFVGFEGAGLRLLEVDSGGAYDLAGLRAGDLIMTVDGAPAVDYAYGRVSQKIKNNKHPRLHVRRGEREFEATLILAPSGSQQVSNRAKIR